MNKVLAELSYKKVFEVTLFFLITYVFLIVTSNSIEKPKGLNNQDIFFEYKEAVKYHLGYNPYSQIAQKNDLLFNHKYPTLLPLYYKTLGIFAQAADYNFSLFVQYYRNFLYLIQIILAGIIYYKFSRNGKILLGAFAAAFYLLNRFTLVNVEFLKQDTVALLFFIGALELLETKKYKNLAYLSYALSLGIKHMGIFAAPIFLMDLIKDKKPKVIAKKLLLLIVPLLIVSWDMFFSEPKGMIYSILFSLTRSPTETDFHTGYGTFLTHYNQDIQPTLFQLMLPRLPLFTFLAVNVWAFFKGQYEKYLYTFLAFFIFFALNPVLFEQYIVWIVPFVFLILFETKNAKLV